MEISEDLCAWLFHKGVLKDLPYTRQNRIFLSEVDTRSFENGLSFTFLLKSLNQACNRLSRPRTPSPDLHSLKESSSAVGKLFNWNILLRVLNKFGISMDSDEKAMIVAGDYSQISGLIGRIYELEQFYLGSFEKPRTIFEHEQDFEKIDRKSLLVDARDCLEFLILVCCQIFKLTPTESAGLFTENNRFLKLIFAKGIKGNLDLPLKWIQTIDLNVSHLARLIQKDASLGAFSLCIEALQPGLESQNTRCRAKTVALLTKLNGFLKYFEKEMWEWMLRIDLFTTVLDMNDWQITTNFVFSFGKKRLLKMITEMLFDYFDNYDYFLACSKLLIHLSKFSKSFKRIEDQEIVSTWIGQIHASSCTSALLLLKDILVYFLDFVKNHESLVVSCFEILHKCVKERKIAKKLVNCGICFKVLEQIKHEKFAIELNKDLVCALTESYNNEMFREFMIRNFMIIEYKDYLAEMYLKQLLATKFKNVNLFDLEFFDFMILKVSSKSAFLLLEYLLFLHLTVPFCREIVEESIKMLVKKFASDRDINRHLIRYFTKAFSYKLGKDNQRVLLLKLTGLLIDLNDPELNRGFEKLLISIHEEKHEKCGKDVWKLLGKLGDPETIINLNKIVS